MTKEYSYRVEKIHNGYEVVRLVKYHDRYVIDPTARPVRTHSEFYVSDLGALFETDRNLREWRV